MVSNEKGTVIQAIPKSQEKDIENDEGDHHLIKNNQIHSIEKLNAKEQCDKLKAVFGNAIDIVANVLFGNSKKIVVVTHFLKHKIFITKEGNNSAFIGLFQFFSLM